MPTDHVLKIQPYKTILQPATDEYIVQKSRFIGHAIPVKSEEEALNFIRKIRQEHPQATHNCYAYVVGTNAGIMRYSDDGEPSGTAGMPMMGVLQAKELVNLCVVVTRYFGGVLLGAGGLVRAYSTSCAQTINKSQLILMEVTRRLVMDVAYPQWDRLQHFLKSRQAVLLEEAEYGVSVTMQLLVKGSETESLIDDLQNLLNQEGDYILSDPFMHYWPASDEEHTS